MFRRGAATIVAFIAFASIPVCAAAVSAERPNIVFMLADDLGYGDLACFGAKDVRTPHIDALARAGVRFTNAYANGPECTPSRTAILTGRYPQRAGGMECPIGTGNVGRYDEAVRLREQNDLGLPPRMAALAPGLKSAGYATALIGKWHMGYDLKFNPLDQGFDRFFGILGGNVDYYRHRELSDLPVFFRDRAPVQRKGYMTDLLRNEAIEFIREQRAGDPPFFLLLSFTAPHFPFQPPGRPDDPMPTAAGWTKGTRENYVAMIQNMDMAVGAVLEALHARGLSRNTLIVFASDHGAMLPGSNGPWRDYKETLFEGGIRTPVIARWPDRIPAGRFDDRVWTLMDLTPSFLQLAGGRVPENRPLDGHPVLVDVIHNRMTSPRDFFWRARRGEGTWRAVRSGSLKFVSRDDAGRRQEWLFDLAEDPGEKNDLLSRQRDAAIRLRSLLADWENRIRSER
ncbi:MAG: sulfatase-like hydrolase/transferase [Verrucomicrobia bacterium]|nr:sulfatase-like hydrolase/transferase [Verrucomicrobiota bacterium]